MSNDYNSQYPLQVTKFWPLVYKNNDYMEVFKWFLERDLIGVSFIFLLPFTKLLEMWKCKTEFDLGP